MVISSLDQNEDVWQKFNYFSSRAQFNMQLKPLLRYSTIIRGSLQPSLPVNFHELLPPATHLKLLKCWCCKSLAVTKEKCILHLGTESLKLGRDRTQIGAKLDRNLAAEIHLWNWAEILREETGQKGMTCDSSQLTVTRDVEFLQDLELDDNWFSQFRIVLNLSTHPAFFSRKHTLRFPWQ